MSFVPLHNYLRRLRRQHCLSQSDVAYLLGVTDRSTVARHESGSKLPSARLVFTYRALYDQPIAALFTGAIDALEVELRARAAELIEKQHGGPRTPQSERRLEALARIAYPDDPVIVPLWNESSR